MYALTMLCNADTYYTFSRLWLAWINRPFQKCMSSCSSLANYSRPPYFCQAARACTREDHCACSVQCKLGAVHVGHEHCVSVRHGLSSNYKLHAQRMSTAHVNSWNFAKRQFLAVTLLQPFILDNTHTHQAILGSLSIKSRVVLPT